MANHKSALKRIRQNTKRNERNKSFRTLVKTVTKKVTAEAEAGNKEQALLELKRAEKVIAKVGGKGLFVKEIETAMLEKSADIAVHSMKDVPAQLARPFQIAAILERGNPLDAFVSTRLEKIDQ